MPKPLPAEVTAAQEGLEEGKPLQKAPCTGHKPGHLQKAPGFTGRTAAACGDCVLTFTVQMGTPDGESVEPGSSLAKRRKPGLVLLTHGVVLCISGWSFLGGAYVAASSSLEEWDRGGGGTEALEKVGTQL